MRAFVFLAALVALVSASVAFAAGEDDRGGSPAKTASSDFALSGNKLTLDVDANSYVYSSADNVVDFYLNGASAFQLSSTGLSGVTNGPRIRNGAGSSTNPSFIPDYTGCATCGLGYNAGALSLTVSGIEEVYVSSSHVLIGSNTLRVRSNIDNDTGDVTVADELTVSGSTGVKLSTTGAGFLLRNGDVSIRSNNAGEISLLDDGNTTLMVINGTTWSVNNLGHDLTAGSCTAKTIDFDTGGSTVEMCWCQSTNTWKCAPMGNLAD